MLPDPPLARFDGGIATPTRREFQAQFAADLESTFPEMSASGVAGKEGHQHGE